jgi:UPF0042 nucleotide-binding protein
MPAGLPRNADLVFDMRFLRNPHWLEALRPGTGKDAEVAAYVAGDPSYDEAMKAIEALLLILLPRYQVEGKPYVTIAFGCTGGDIARCTSPRPSRSGCATQHFRPR